MKSRALVSIALFPVVLIACSDARTTAPTGRTSPAADTATPTPSQISSPATIKDGRVACFTAAIQRDSRDELANEIGAKSKSLNALVTAISTSTVGTESEQLSSFEIGCREGLRRAGVLEGKVRPMSSSALFPMFIEVCATTARAAGDIDVAAEAIGAEADPEAIARGFMTLIATERGIAPPEPAVQACTRGFLRVFASGSA